MEHFTDTSIARGGYVREPRPSHLRDRRTKYPWKEIKEGDRVDRVFEWNKLASARISIRNWNQKNQTAISVTPFPHGTKEHPFPHFVVGWGMGDKFDPENPRRT